MSRHFFIAGAQRSGTTYLHTILTEHPEIELNQPWWPEPKFFLNEDAPSRIDEYLKKYYFRNDEPLHGEKSVCYMEHTEVIERIARSFPDARIIFILRDPVDRAISNYWYSFGNQLENATIEQALMDESFAERPYDKAKIIGCPPYYYLRRGKYSGYLDKYLEYFDRSQIKILVSEVFFNNARAISDLFEFLNIKSDFSPPSMARKVNSYLPSDKDMSGSQVEKFLTNYYAESVADLTKRYGVDTSHWKSAKLLRNTATS
ncbi:MAG: sulfotransferase [Candidatus Obscuribacterales bacterium]|nr:sulfotransferase [Candidatus Obscuribacterales bacterium]